jgi:hypothetical protein
MKVSNQKAYYKLNRSYIWVVKKEKILLFPDRKKTLAANADAAYF